MRPAHALAVLACLTPLAQEDEPSFEEELAALIERTNALASFRLVYDVESTSDGETKEGTIELLYRAPDFFRAQVSGFCGDMDFWLSGDEIHVYTLERGWMTGRFQEPAVCALLDQRFPPADGAVLRDITVFMDLRLAEGPTPELDVRGGRTLGERTYLLAWLGALRGKRDVAREEGFFVWGNEDLRRRISRRTGLVEELAYESAGTRRQVRLRSAELDVELPPQLLEPPRAARDEPEDPEFSRQLQMPTATVRERAFKRADQWLTRTRGAFDESARADWRAVLEALHRPALEAMHARMDADMGAMFAKAAEHLREERARDPSAERLATLTEELGKSRAGGEAGLAKALKKQLESLDLPVSRVALLEVEQELFPALWDELVAAPILARHDEELAAALER
jgi:hypothetical protein